MLKKIAISDLRLGMHLHALDGTWLANPLWRSCFLLERQSDLDQLRGCGIAHCWIDVAKGVDVQAAADPAGHLTAKATPPVAPAMPAVPVATAAPSSRRSMADELGRAARLIKESRQVVALLYNQARLGQAIDAENCAALVAEITESGARNAGALTGLLRLKTHDDYSYLHSVSVCALMVALARRLGFDAYGTRDAGMAGLLHDVGKAVMPLEILNKPGKLTDAEFAVIKCHPSRGHDILRQGIGVPAAALDVCLRHHERPDGKGYPGGVSGAALSLLARMGAVCDVYDAITSNRPYKAGWDPAESIARMADWTKAGQFDSMVFAAFVKNLGMYPVGSLVRLHSGRLAVVIEQNEAVLNKPRVRVFFSTRAGLPLPREAVDLADPACTDSIVGRESNREWKFTQLDEMWVHG